MSISILILILLILILLVICVLNKEHLSWEGVHGKKDLWGKTRWWYHKIAPDCHKSAKIPYEHSGYPYAPHIYRNCIKKGMDNFVDGMSRFPRYRNLSRGKWNEILAASISKEFGKPPLFFFNKHGELKPI